MRKDIKEPEYIKYLESRCDMLALQLAELQAAAATVCIKANMRKASILDYKRLADTIRAAEWSADADRAFKQYYT
jgi:hypothetical protein